MRGEPLTSAATCKTVKLNLHRRLTKLAGVGRKDGRVVYVKGSIGAKEVTALAVWLLFSASICLVFAIWPPTEQSPQDLDVITGLTLAAVALVVVVGSRRRFGPALINVSLAVGWLGIVIMTASRTAAPSQVVWAFPLVLAAAFAAYYLSIRAYAFHLLAMALGYGTAMLFFGPQISGIFGAIAIATMVTSSLALRYVRTSRDVALAELHQLATTDPLTQVLNRRGLQQQAPGLHSSAERAGTTTSLVAMDLDHFKQYNDEYGHAQGDELLKHLTQQWRECLREGDLIARLGGDEFLLVLPNAGAADTEALLARMRERTAGLWTSGYTQWDSAHDLWQAVSQADEALYRAKSKR
jgi:diguanylate cyclase (GGDEF)-like protein